MAITRTPKFFSYGKYTSRAWWCAQKLSYSPFLDRVISFQSINTKWYLRATFYKTASLFFFFCFGFHCQDFSHFLLSPPLLRWGGGGVKSQEKGKAGNPVEFLLLKHFLSNIVVIVEGRTKFSCPMMTLNKDMVEQFIILFSFKSIQKSICIA